MKQTQEQGYTLLEMTAVVAIVAIVATMGAPLIQQQLARREVETMARRFIQHAQFARQAALFGAIGQGMEVRPRGGDWNRGWDVYRQSHYPQPDRFEPPAALLSQGAIDPVEIDRRGSGFSGPNGQQKRIEFTSSGAAKTQNGGFVANRLIFRHSQVEGIERHAILSSGGRWRLCDPRQDSKSCR